MHRILRQKYSLAKIFGEELITFSKKSSKEPISLENYIEEKWTPGSNHETVLDPLQGTPMAKSPSDTSSSFAEKVVSDLSKCPKSGLHNPFKNPERYRMWGDVYTRMINLLHQKDVETAMIDIQNRVMPKSPSEAFKEFMVFRQFVENFTGDSPRFALKGFTVAGDRPGQITNGTRFPYGPCMIISPFNFPLEIPGLQLLGGLLPGNKILLKPDSRTGAIAQALVKLLLYCGAPPESVMLVHGNGQVAQKILETGKNTIRLLQFTGSSKIAEKVTELLNGKAKIEDSGMNWKILGPDVSEVTYVSQQIDQDSFACSGQKCSAQRLLFVHENWMKTDLLEQLKKRATQRSYKNQLLSPILSWTNQALLSQIDQMLKIPKANLLFGGKIAPDSGSIPKNYGSILPTAIHFPLEAFNSHFPLLTTEIFGPVLSVFTYKTEDLPKILSIFEKIKFHLTASVVSNDPQFIQKIVGNSINGVTYTGIRARNTGAPQNHWFGPAGDPRAAGIGTIEAIQHVWTCHREVITDVGEWGEKLPDIKQG